MLALPAVPTGSSCCRLAQLPEMPVCSQLPGSTELSWPLGAAFRRLRAADDVQAPPRRPHPTQGRELVYKMRSAENESMHSPHLTRRAHARRQLALGKHTGRRVKSTTGGDSQETNTSCFVGCCSARAHTRVDHSASAKWCVVSGVKQRRSSQLRGKQACYSAHQL